jgi:CubicO group peptidase (beta-lactamase class C family)
MEKWGVPGGAVAVAKDGRLVLAKGYGVSDLEASQPAQPDQLWRIASNSKPITAVTVLQLVDEGRLDLDSRVVEILRDLAPPAGAPADARIAQVTVRQLLWHVGGWDREASFDPMFADQRIAQATGHLGPQSCEAVIRYMWTQPLDFDPGSKYAYSNFGYCVLGRVIERASSQPYDQRVLTSVLSRANVARMRTGHSLLAGRADGEVRYNDYPGAPLVPSIYPEVPGRVPRPYGGFNLEAMDSLGGWISSPIDLLRFATAVDGQRGPALLTNESVQLMLSRPPYVSQDAATYYGMGWLVRPTAGGANWWHAGELSGTVSYLVRLSNGVSYAAMFNMSPRDWNVFTRELDAALGAAQRQVSTWPDGDLFSSYP